MEIEVHKGSAPAAPPNGGTNGHGNGNGGGIAVPVVEALAPVTAPEPVVTAETAAAGGEQSASTDSESGGAQENEGGAAEAAQDNGDEEAPPSNDEQLPRQLQDGDLVVFRPWRIGPFVSKLVAVNLTKALAERPGGQWSDKIRDSYGPVKNLLDSVGEAEVKTRLWNIVRSGEDGHRFTARQAKDIVNKFLLRVAYAILPNVEGGLRVWFVNHIHRMEEEWGWFCPAAQYDEEMAGYRRWEKEQERRAAAERHARETARGADEMLGAMSLLGGEVAVVVPTKAGGDQPKAIKVGDRLRGTVKEVAIGFDKRHQRRYVAGLRFELESGNEAFAPFAVIGWNRMSYESEEDLADSLRKYFPEGQVRLLEVSKIEPNEKMGGMRVLVRILDETDIGPADRQARPGLKIGEEVAGRVEYAVQNGVMVRLFAPDIRLFAPVGELASGTSPADYRRGTQVEGIVIQGVKKPFELRITKIDELERQAPAPEHILHPERVEDVRRFIVDSGVHLDEEVQMLFRGNSERARLMQTIPAEEVESARAFFGELLKDVADVPAEVANAVAGVVTTRGAYRKEQEEAVQAESGGVEEDQRPFCRNHEQPEGEWRCDKRAAKLGDLCDRCKGREGRMSARAPKPPKSKDKKSGCKACLKEGGPCKKHRKEAAAA